MILQKPVIVNQTYYDRYPIKNDNKCSLPVHKLTMLGQWVDIQIGIL